MATDSKGRYVPQGDWRDQREIHRLIADAQGLVLDPTASIPDAEWKAVERVVAAYRRMRECVDRPVCAVCDKIIKFNYVIRCVDCGIPMHEEWCAAKHFWPKGRPVDTYPTLAGQPLTPDPSKR